MKTASVTRKAVPSGRNARPRLERGRAGERGRDGPLQECGECQDITVATQPHGSAKLGRQKGENRALERRVARVGRLPEGNGIGVDAAGVEQLLAGARVLDVALEATDHVAPVAVASQPTLAVHEARIEQLDERGEVVVEAVVGRGGQKEQGVRALSEDFGEAPALRVLPVACGAEAHAVMGLVDDHQVVAALFDVLRDALLLGEIDRDESGRPGVGKGPRQVALPERRTGSGG
jgi:hypothetical protein